MQRDAIDCIQSEDFLTMQFRRRDILRGARFLTGLAATYGLGAKASADGHDNRLSAYEVEYRNQMSTEAPDVPNLTAAVSSAEKGAVYANRNSAEFAISTWNFEPSSNPLRFAEALRPLSDADQSHLESTNTDGFIVVKDGAIIHEYYAKGMHPTTKHNIYSTGKSWTSAAWHESLLPVLDKTVGELMPELQVSVYGTQKVGDVVDMRTPVFWYEDFDDPESPVVQSGTSAGWDFKNIDFEQIAFLKTLRRNPDLADGDWYYVSANTMVMGLLGSKLKGVHAYEGLRQFYDALGLEYISGTVANLHGQYSAEGGQYFALRDFIKLPYAMANGGVVDGRNVISVAYIDDVFTSDDRKQAAWKNSPYGKKLDVFRHYSNQWYVADQGIAAGIGSYGQYIVFNRKTNVALAMFSTYPTGQNFDFAGQDVNWLVEKARSY